MVIWQASICIERHKTLYSLSISCVNQPKDLEVITFRENKSIQPDRPLRASNARYRLGPSARKYCTKCRLPGNIVTFIKEQPGFLLLIHLPKPIVSSFFFMRQRVYYVQAGGLGQCA